MMNLLARMANNNPSEMSVSVPALNSRSPPTLKRKESEIYAVPLFPISFSLISDFCFRVPRPVWEKVRVGGADQILQVSFVQTPPEFGRSLGLSEVGLTKRQFGKINEADRGF